MRRIGLAVGPASLTATVLGRRGSHVQSQAIPQLCDDDEDWTEVRAAFATLGASLGQGPALVYVALLPPLVQVRRIELPFLQDRELTHVLGRDVGRYLPGITTPHVVGVQRLRSGRRSPSPVLLAATPAWLVERLAEAIASHGWRMEAVGPAHAAWAARSQDRAVVVLGETSAEVLHVCAGRLRDVRRTTVTPDRIAAALPVDGGSPLVLGSNRERGELIRHALGLSDAGMPTSGENEDLLAEYRAAESAIAVRGFELVPEHAKAVRSEWTRRVARRLWLTTAALLLLSVGLVRWDLARELGAAREARAAIRHEVGQAMEARTHLNTTQARLAFLATAEARAPRWTGLLGALAQQLPQDASLLSLRARGDTLVLEGVADQAGGVLEALPKASWVAGVQANAPIRQESGDGSTAEEHFAVTVRLRVPVDSSR